MSQDFERDHFKLMEDVNQDMKNMVVEVLAQPSPEIGKCTFTRDGLGKSGVLAISPPPIFISKEFKELAHILKAINIAEQIGQEQAWRIITRRSLN